MTFLVFSAHPFNPCRIVKCPGSSATQIQSNKKIVSPHLAEEICSKNLDIPEILKIYKSCLGMLLPPELKVIFLFAGVRGDDHVVVYQMLASGVSIQSQDHLGRTPLHVAAEMDLILMAKLLIDSKAPVNVKIPTSGKTPLHLAVDECNDVMVQILLEAGALASVGNIAGLTPFEQSFSSTSKIFTLFLDRQLDLLAIDEDGNSILHKMVLHGTDGPIIELIKRAQAAGSLDLLLEAVNNLGETALIVSAKDTGSISKSKLLVNSGSKLNAQGLDGRSALHWASLMNHSALVFFLLSKSADANVGDKNLMTPVHLSICGCALNSLLTLIDGGTSLDSLDTRGNSAAEIVEILYDFLLNFEDSLIEDSDQAVNDAPIPYYISEILSQLNPAAACWELEKMRDCLFLANLNRSLMRSRQESMSLAGLHTHSPFAREGESSIRHVDGSGEEIPFLKIDHTPSPVTKNGVQPLFSWVKV